MHVEKYLYKKLKTLNLLIEIANQICITVLLLVIIF